MENNYCTIFEQDGKVYTVISHAMPTRELAKHVGAGIRRMVKIPRANMRTVTIDQFKTMPFGKPSET